MLRRVFSRRAHPKKSLPNAIIAPSGNMHMMQSSGAMSTSSVTTSSAIGLDKLGITNPSKVNRNLSYEDLMAHEKKNGEGKFTKNGTFAVDTGKFTGRSPNDKWIVKQSPSAENIWWGNVNKPTTTEVFDELYEKCVKHYNTLDDIYVFDGYCGASPKTRKNVRFITELAWQSHFVTNMFIRPSTTPSNDFAPDFTVINACKVVNDNWEKHGLNSEVFIAFNIEKRVAIIGGTWYGGEMKKGIFSMMNYWLPLQNIMTMHCSANVGKNKDVALFFGLSGTGKTTLSADPKRELIGDDEHGWDEDGVFNLEGGCYAKTINLTEENEPDIYRAIRPNAMLENVHIDEKTNEVDYFNVSKTQNGRVSYPIHFIDNYEKSSTGGHAKNCIFLTCDAFGVLPPVSRLSPDQAMYHFLSGYTAKVAGTERGVNEPTATFSACFGAAFLTLHPTKYADLLKVKLSEHQTQAYLVNTGWIGGAAGTADRISIKHTRQCIDAILDGSIAQSEFVKDPVFGFEIPKTLGSVPSNILNPREAWKDQGEYDNQRKKLADMFIKNYEKYIIPGVTDYSKHGPRV